MKYEFLQTSPHVLVPQAIYRNGSSALELGKHLWVQNVLWFFLPCATLGCMMTEFKAGPALFTTAVSLGTFIWFAITGRHGPLISLQFFLSIIHLIALVNHPYRWQQTAILFLYLLSPIPAVLLASFAYWIYKAYRTHYIELDRSVQAIRLYKSSRDRREFQLYPWNKCSFKCVINETPNGKHTVVQIYYVHIKLDDELSISLGEFKRSHDDLGTRNCPIWHECHQCIDDMQKGMDAWFQGNTSKVPITF